MRRLLHFLHSRRWWDERKVLSVILTVRRENCLQECDAHVHSLSLATILRLSFSLLSFHPFSSRWLCFSLFPYFLFLFPSFGFTTNNFSLSVSLSQDCQSSGRRRGFLCGFSLPPFHFLFLFSLFFSHFNRISMHECDDGTLEAANGPFTHTIQSHLFVLLPSLTVFFMLSEQMVWAVERRGKSLGRNKEEGKLKRKRKTGKRKILKREKMKMEKNWREEKLERERESAEKVSSKHQF